MELTWKRSAMLLAGTSVLFYAVIVIGYSYCAPDLGLHTAFDPTVRRFEGECRLATAGPSDFLREKDQIIEIGGTPIATWPQLLQALIALGNKTAQPVSSLDEKDVRQVRFVCLDGEDFVHLGFVRPGNSSALSCWCRVGRPAWSELVPSVLWFFLKVGLFLVGIVVYWKRQDDASARQFFLLGLVTLGAYMGGYNWSRIAGQRELILVFMVCAVLLPAILLHFYLVFPRPNSLLQCHSVKTLATVYGVPMAFLLAMSVTYFRIRWLGRNSSQDDVNAGLNVLLAEIYAYIAVAAIWYLASVACLIRSYRASIDAMERNQVKWILFGSLVALIPIGATLYLAALHSNAFSAGDATWPMFAASVCFTAAFIISITRYRLMQLDQILSSGVIYFVFSFLAVAVYYAIVFLAMFLAGSRTGSPLPDVLTLCITVMVLMLLLDLVRGRLRRVLDRRLHREKYQLDRTFRRMGKAIEQLIDPPTLARQLLQTSAEVMGVRHGAVYLRQGKPPLYQLADVLGPMPVLTELALGCPIIEWVRSHGTLLAPPNRRVAEDPVQRQIHLLGGEVAQPLYDEGELLALLILGSRASGPYTPEDLNLLAAFAQLTALALRSAERHRTIDDLNRDLQAKVEKISEQQRRIIALQGQLTAQVARPSSVIVPPVENPHGIVGSSPVVQQLLQLARKVSASNSAVLIRGESGTGKELLARALHENSSRSGKPFVKVHCAALSPGILESELFGHVKGAFTGAHRDKVGRFELADGGTLFLDEIGDISLEVQTKLLRVLQEKIFERVGSSEPVEVDVRVIAATHQDLEKLITQGRFREDLFYRLNVISTYVPALRERREDIVELAYHFLKLQCQQTGKPMLQIDDDALAALKGYHWPGNIRQLENVIERAVVISEKATIGVTELPPEILAALDGQLPAAEQAEGLNGYHQQPLGIVAERAERDRSERQRLLRALAAASGNKAEAARALGLARSTLISRLKKHGLS
jgi:transcriptional regulator with GAF, ATPase, and Fis domain